MSEEDKKDLLRRLERLASDSRELRTEVDKAANAMGGLVQWLSVEPKLARSASG